MLNGIWAGMILLAVIYGAATGRMAEVTNAALDSAGEAISLCITMAGVVALWMGLMEIAGKAGLVEKLTRGIRPFLRFLFPRIPQGHQALGYIAANIIANVLGLGWACTPAGLKAMEELAKLEAERGNPEYLESESDDIAGSGKGRYMQGKQAGSRYREEKHWEEKQIRRDRGRCASNEMCIFLILNISSLQLIPVNMIAYRSQYGSANPTAIIAPAIAATLVSTLVAIIYCKIKDHFARTGVEGSCMSKSRRGGSADLTASEIRRMSGRGAGFCRDDAAAGISSSSERQKGRGGKAV